MTNHRLAALGGTMIPQTHKVILVRPASNPHLPDYACGQHALAAREWAPLREFWRPRPEFRSDRTGGFDSKADHTASTDSTWRDAGRLRAVLLRHAFRDAVQHPHRRRGQAGAAERHYLCGFLRRTADRRRR